MNESKKTGIFWCVAAVMAAIAAVFAWPTASTDEGVRYTEFINQDLFAEFKDPLAAASLKIAVFDEERGELKNFEVRRDRETGLWTIPSKGGYPADAIEQMRDAANAMVGLKALDAPTDNPEDHAGMGVLEPKLEDLSVGDEGVGRLVTFKDDEQNVLASLIIGDKVKGTDDQIYVRKPGQDLVYAVQLDDKPLTTKFEDWIEEDLLQLSSIDIENVEIKDYSASLGLGNRVALNRKYQATLTKDGSKWELASLKEYDETKPLAEPTEVEVDPEKKLNSQKLNDLTNALDDLKFVNVLRKPEGISANLRANKDFAEDPEATSQLANRGFLPIPLGPDREIEIFSANGELTATTKEGVQYILRFGNVSGLSEEDEKSKEDAEDEKSEESGGLNRYLMVSTIVDESKFPLPELKSIPQNLEELDALDKPAAPPGTTLPPELNAPADSEKTEDSPVEAADGTAEMKEEPASTEESSTEEKSEAVDEDKPVDENSKEEKPENAEDSKEEASPESDDADKDEADTAEASDSDADAGEAEANESDSSGESTDSGETDASGEGESTTVGEAQAENEQASESESSEPELETGGDAEASEEAEPSEKETVAEAPSDETDDNAVSEEKPSDEASAEMKADDSQDEIEETEEEKLERLAAVQEKITKENERKLEERKDKIEAAKRRSRELNDRFADWYYVIPEETYTKLRIGQSDLFDTSDGPANPAAGIRRSERPRPPNRPPAAARSCLRASPAVASARVKARSRCETAAPPFGDSDRLHSGAPRVVGRGSPP